MSPGLDEFKWLEYRDFSGGLWERTDREAPQNGLLTLTDAHPMKNGGLRAYAKFKAMTHTGLPTNAIVLALRKTIGFPGPQGVLMCCTLELDAGGSGVHTFRVHVIQNDTTTALIESGTWTTIYTQTGVANIDPSISIEMYHTLANGFGQYFNVNALDTAGASTSLSGVFRTSTTAVLTATVLAGVGRVIVGNFYPTCLVPHQDRLMFNVTAPGSLTLSRVLFTEPRSDTTPSTANQFEPIGTDAGFIGWMSPQAPSDLTVGKDERGIILVQGDVTQPLIREMTFSQYGMVMFPATTEYGIVYLAENSSVYLWNTAGLKDLSYQFYETPMQPDVYPASFGVVFSSAVKLGTMAYGGGYVFAGRDYVLDLETEAWFRVSTLAENGSGKHFTTDPHNYRVYSATNAVYTGINSVLYYTPSYYEASSEWDPASSYSFTLPMIYEHGRKVKLREIDYYLTTFSANNTLEVEVTRAHPTGGTPITETLQKVTLDVATNHKVRYPVAQSGDWLKIKTTLTAPDGEAPMLERVMVGLQPETRSEVVKRA